MLAQVCSAKPAKLLVPVQVCSAEPAQLLVPVQVCSAEPAKLLVPVQVCSTEPAQLLVPVQVCCPWPIAAHLFYWLVHGIFHRGTLRVWKLDLPNRKIWPSEVKLGKIKRTVTCIEVMYSVLVKFSCNHVIMCVFHHVTLKFVTSSMRCHFSGVFDVRNKGFF